MRLPAIEAKDREGGASAGHTSSFATAGLACGVCSRQGKRPYQEDEPSVRAYLQSSSKSPSSAPLGGIFTAASVSSPAEQTHMFALFDGHAGGKCSKFLSENLATFLAEDPCFATNLGMAIKRSFHTANEQFLKLADRYRLQDGSTGICCVLRNGKLVVGNVGDCRAVILSGGKAVQLSKDQKPTNPEEQKRISSLGGTVMYCMGIARVNGVLAVSRAFGNRNLRTVIRPDAEITTRDLSTEDDFLVIASDGMWDILRNNDVSLICYAQAAQGAQHLAEELVQTALSRGSMDNVTCIVVRLSGYMSSMSKSLLDVGGVKGVSSSPVLDVRKVHGGGDGSSSSSSLADPPSITSKLAPISLVKNMLNFRNSPLQTELLVSEDEIDKSTAPAIVKPQSFGTLPRPQATNNHSSGARTTMPVLFQSLAGTSGLGSSLLHSRLEGHNRLQALNSPISFPSNAPPKKSNTK